jgi:competence protein ComGC
MLRNQKGISVYTVLSVILFIALILLLALPNFYNLDKQKNIDDCTNHMKAIWVAATDYVRDTGKDYGGDLSILRSTRKKEDPKKVYLDTKSFCPESQRDKKDYIVFGKFVQETLPSGEIKQNTGVIVVCPELDKYPKHYINKSFYENMSPTNLQNYMIEDMDQIDQQTKSNGEKKMEAVRKYINLWKTDPQAFEKRKADKDSLLREIFPNLYQPALPELPE